jgi:predicted O-methyltransferase YrrM
MFRDKPLHNFLFETDPDAFYQNLQTWCTPWIDVCCLLHLIRHVRPKTFLEIGTHRGYTTRIIADRFPALQITTCDPGDQIPTSARPSNQTGEYLAQDKVGELVADRANVQIIKKAFHDIDWGDQKFDVIFVDGNHTLNDVTADSLLALKLLAPKGAIMWHDVNNVQDVNKALKQLDTPGGDIVSIHNTWVAYYVAP